MDWVGLSESYPKGVDEYLIFLSPYEWDWKIYFEQLDEDTVYGRAMAAGLRGGHTIRRLYDFFDSKNITVYVYAEIIKRQLLFSYVVMEWLSIEARTGGFTERIVAEASGFWAAFKVLEKRLNTKEFYK